MRTKPLSYRINVRRDPDYLRMNWVAEVIGPDNQVVACRRWYCTAAEAREAARNLKFKVMTEPNPARI